jgi:hypothetical protein
MASTLNLVMGVSHQSMGVLTINLSKSPFRTQINCQMQVRCTSGATGSCLSGVFIASLPCAAAADSRLTAL